MKRGLTLGKYAPLHKGHQLLLDTALAEMDEVIIIIYDAPETTLVPLSIRSGWIRKLYPQTKVIGLYVEGLGDGRKFVNTAKKVISERKKPIVVFKNGRTTRGAKQAASHTGSLGGTYSVVKGAFSQNGITDR